MFISVCSSDVCSSYLAQIDHGGRRGGVRFQAPDISKYVAKLPLRTPSLMADLYTLSFEDILDYLVELGKRLAFDPNQHVRAAFRLSCITSGLSERMLRFHSSHFVAMFARTELRRLI